MVSILKLAGYIYHYKILPANNFGLILKNKMAATVIFMLSLCGVGVRVNNFSSKTTRPRDMLFFKRYLIYRG